MRPGHRRHGNATLLAIGDYLGLEFGTELAPVAPTFLCDKLVRMHYSTYWDELLHQEAGGAAILYDLPLGFKMVLPDAYETPSNRRSLLAGNKVRAAQRSVMNRISRP